METEGAVRARARTHTAQGRERAKPAAARALCSVPSAEGSVRAESPRGGLERFGQWGRGSLPWKVREVP